jgi:hypothetical protein
MQLWGAHEMAFDQLLWGIAVFICSTGWQKFRAVYITECCNDLLWSNQKAPAY